MAYKVNYFGKTPAVVSQAPFAQPDGPAPTGYIQSAWNRTKETLGAATKPLGDGLGSGFASGVKKEFETLVQPGNPLAAQFKESIEQALIKQVTPEVRQLLSLMQKILERTEEITEEDLVKTDELLTLLLQNNAKLLIELAPTLNIAGLALCRATLDLIKEQVEQEVSTYVNSDSEDEDFGLSKVESFILDVTDDEKIRSTLQNFCDLLNEAVQQSEGAMVHAIGHLQHALLSENGLFNQTKDYLSEALNNEEKGVIAKSIALFNTKLRAKDGPLDYLEKRLTEEDKGILSKAAHVLYEKLMGKGGILDAMDEKLTAQAHPLLCKIRDSLMDLQNAVLGNDLSLIKKHAQSLESLLESLFLIENDVFSKKALSEEDYTKLVVFKKDLDGFYKDPIYDQKFMLISVEKAMGVINIYYTSFSGIAARTADILNQSLNAKLDRMEHLVDRVEMAPKVMVDNLLGNKPTEPKAEPKKAEKDVDPAVEIEGGTVSHFLTHGSSLLQTLLQTGKQAVSKGSLNAIASVLMVGLKYAYDNLEEGAAFDEVRITLEKIMASLEEIQKTGQWKDLFKELKKAALVLKGVKIYVNGFRLPSLDTSTPVPRNAELIYADNIATLQEAMQIDPIVQNTQDWKAQALEEKNLMINNQAQYLTLKHIYEGIYKLKPIDDKFYIRLLTKIKGAVDPEGLLKTLLFDEIDKAKGSTSNPFTKIGNFFTKIYAQVNYYFYGSIVKSLIAKATTNFFNEIFDYIEKNKINHFDPLRNQITLNSTRFLTNYGIALGNVAKLAVLKNDSLDKPEQYGTIREMLQAELEKKEYNLGFDTSELYMTFAQDVIKKTLTISGFPSWLSSPLIYLAEKFIGNPEAIIRSIVDKATSSIQDTRGYTHAMNSVILDQLNDVWNLMQKNMTRESANELGDLALSDGKKAQLSALIKNLFLILPKSKCATLDELRDLIKGTLLSANINKGFDDLFIEEVLEKVTHMLAITMQSLIKEDQLQKLTYKFAYLINRTYEVGDEVTEKEMHDVERNISKRSEQILRLAINSSVEDHFDFTGRKQQKEANGFVTQLHERSKKYFDAVAGDLQTLSTMSFESDAARIKINKIIEEATAFQAECYEANFQAKSSHINSDNKDEIAARYLKIAEQTAPFVVAIKDLTLQGKKLEHIQTATPIFKQIQSMLAAIGLETFVNDSMTQDDLKAAEEQIASLDTHLKTLTKMSAISQEVSVIRTQIESLAHNLVELKKALMTRQLEAAESMPGARIAQLCQARKESLNHLGLNTDLQTAFERFRQELIQSVDNTHLPLLIRELKNLEEAKTDQQATNAQSEFVRLLQDASNTARETVALKKDIFWQSYTAIHNAIKHTQILNPEKIQDANLALQESIELATEHLKQLRDWEQQNIREIPYINVPVLDMKGVQDWASGIIYSRVRERLDGLIGFLKQDEIYRYGFLNHLFLIPYVQMIQKEEGKA